MRSLRLRLFSFLVLLSLAVAAAVGSATYASVRADADELFDYQLRQMALSLRDQVRIPEGERTALANLEFDYLVQIWSIEGVEIYSSLPPAMTRPLPTRAVLGFSNIDVDGKAWRMFVAATPLRVVQVGQPLAVRRELATAAAWRSVLPIGVAAPLVALAMWWLVGASLAPLQRVVAAARSRDANRLDPLPERDLPTEVVPLVDAFNALLARLAGAFDAQRAFVADAAHELRTPLTALKLQIGVLRDAREGADRDAALLRLRAGIDRAAHLVEQLLALARAEPGAVASRSDLDLVAVARDALADAAPLAAQRHCAVDLDAPPALPMRGDVQALRSLVRNLVDNAFHYGCREGEPAACVRVSLTVEAGEAVLRVDDAGPGIPPAERERVFNRFHRRDASRGEGTGLGLAIVRAVATQHGGRVKLDDSPIGGLRVEVRLPLRSAGDATGTGAAA
jgi:signal transduction histidine kinase